jgi:outer membrane receptor for Fe3+-dicitrate
MLLRFSLVILLSLPAWCQRDSATLEVTLLDPQSAVLAGCMDLTNANKGFHIKKCAQAGEKLTIKDMPEGRYNLVATCAGFAPNASVVEIRAGERKAITLSLAVAPVVSEIKVEEAATLLDPTGASGQRLSSGAIANLPAAMPGRDVIQAVQTQPGWIVEANGVLHPRGSEYDTLYIVDGLPISSNRSPTFAPETGLNQVDAIEMTTSGYPAEYGRHLGGVVEVTTATPRVDGLHGNVDFEQGSFATSRGSASIGYGGKRTGVWLGLNGFTTDWYLDPPVEQNFTNSALGRSIGARFDHEFGATQSLRFWFTNSQTRFQVPNEIVQELAGQRQSRSAGESAGYISYERVLSPDSVLSARFMVRDADATLSSNVRSIPIQPEQDRSLRESYFSLNVATQRGHHEFKAGTQFSLTNVNEQFSFNITDPTQFDPDVPPQFAFAGKRSGDTQAVFVQDRYHRGPWTLSAGVRWDRYSLVTGDSAFSPRLALAYHFAPLGLVLHASYDRVFEEPPIENLLLANSTSVLRLSSAATQFPVPLSRGDFGEVGFSKLATPHARLDAKAFLRNTRNFIDDDLLLNTGVSLPTSFARATIYGAEAKLDVTEWWRFSGFASYSYQIGRTITPVTGGLFLEDNAEQLLQPGIIFPISQDQRNTAYGLLRFAISKSLWTAASFSYGSGLPTELDPGESLADLIAQSSPRIVQQVDLARGRLKPNHSLDCSLGWNVWSREPQSARVQVDVTNLTNKLNVVNFAGLFSGTALARPRSASVRLSYSF